MNRTTASAVKKSCTIVMKLNRVTFAETQWCRFFPALPSVYSIFYRVNTEQRELCLFQVVILLYSLWFAKFYFLFTQPYGPWVMARLCCWRIIFSNVAARAALILLLLHLLVCGADAVVRGKLTQLPKFKTKTNDEFSWRKEKPFEFI